MTDGDEHAVIGRKYVERETAKRELSALAKKSLCVETVLRETADALKARREDQGNVAIPREFPNRQEITDLLERQAKLLADVRNVDAFFESRGASPS